MGGLMIKNMLKAVSEMLKVKADDIPAEAFAKVDCAKIMLDKIIEGMEDKPVKPVEHITTPSTPSVQPTPDPDADKPKWSLTKDKEGGLKVLGTPPRGQKVDLDGVVMTLKDAVGKTFKVGKVL